MSTTWEDVEIPQGSFIGWHEIGQKVTGKVVSFAAEGGTDFNQNPCPQIVIELTESALNFKEKGAERETITDPTTVFNRAAAAGVNSEAFMACVSVTKGKLKDAVKLATGEKGKALDARIETILAGCTETKAAAPSLAKVKEVA